MNNIYLLKGVRSIIKAIFEILIQYFYYNLITVTYFLFNSMNLKILLETDEMKSNTDIYISHIPEMKILLQLQYFMFQNCEYISKNTNFRNQLKII